MNDAIDDRPLGHATTAPPVAAGERIDAFLTASLGGGHARAEIQKWIKDGRLRVNDSVCAKPGLKLRGGERLELSMPEQAAHLAPEQGELRILFADDHLAVLDKPPNLTVHPAPGLSSGTLAHRLLAHFPGIGDMDSLRPGIVHRLDKDTSGVMLVALTNAARLRLADDFAERRVDKSYLAVVHGRPARDAGRIDAPIGRDPDHPAKMAVARKGGREALSEYRRLWSDPEGRLSLLHVTIHTGRTHQIRVHLAHIGHPVVGDAVYGSKEKAALRRERPLAAKLARRQLLHAWRIRFRHPASDDPMEFTAPPPRDLAGFVRLASRGPMRVVLVGPVGGGKSSVMSLIENAGWPAISADAVVAGLYRAGADGWTLLRRRFGERFAKDSGVDKKALLAAMLASPAMKREVEEIVHPLVRHVIDEFWRENAKARAAFAEVPLFFEAGWRAADADVTTVFVDCADEVRLVRIAGRGQGLSPETIAALDGWQWPAAAKRAKCDFVIDNSGTPIELASKVADLLEALRVRRAERARAFVFPLPADRPDSPICLCRNLGA